MGWDCRRQGLERLFEKLVDKMLWNGFFFSSFVSEFLTICLCNAQLINVSFWYDPCTLVSCYSFFLLYNIVLVLPYINMNPPQVYMCSPSWTPSLLPPCTIPLGLPSAPAPSIQCQASNLDWWFVSYMILYMFQCHSPRSSHSLPLPQGPEACSIHLCLFFCLA